MGIMRRLFSVDYRRALAAEAQGDFLAAARHYALCGDRPKVADMHLAQARLEKRPEERIRALRSALSFLDAGDSRRAMVLRLLGGALRERVQREPCEPAERRELLLEAAALLEEGESWEQAGDCFLELGDQSRAANVYAKGGLVERVEEVLSQHEQAQGRLRREDTCFRDYELHLQGGERDDAAEALRACVEAAAQKGEYRRLLATLEERLLTSGRVELEAEGHALIVVGRFPLLIGREADCDLQARGSSVSRHHARVYPGEDGQLLIADCGSRNGTLLEGMPLGAPLPLPPAATVGLGDSCQLQLTLSQGEDPPTSVVRVEVTSGMDRGRSLVVTTAPLLLAGALAGAPPLELRFTRGRPFVRALEGRLSLNGALIGGEVQLIRGDVVTVAERSLRVVA